MNVERIKLINPEELARPSGFSHAVAATGRMVFLAGQIGMDRDGKVVGGGVVPQFEQALGNLLTALAAAGGQPADLFFSLRALLEEPAQAYVKRTVSAD